jgi:NAD(P)-dependent dehydrogenase (short-subunit alcohol dehydrogenase family)
MDSLKGKVALVTGASRGAGRAIAAVLGEAGATVYMTAAPFAVMFIPRFCQAPL